MKGFQMKAKVEFFRMSDDLSHYNSVGFLTISYDDLTDLEIKLERICNIMTQGTNLDHYYECELLPKQTLTVK